MRTRILGEAGFSLAETMIALAIMGVGMLALASNTHFFMKSNYVAESRGEHLRLRGLMGQALSQKRPDCHGSGGDPRGKDCCIDSVQTPGSLTAGVSIPGFDMSNPSAITVDSGIDLALSLGGGTPFVRSGEILKRERLNNVVRLIGDFRARVLDPPRIVYSGAVELQTTRMGEDSSSAPMISRVPIEFEVDNSGKMTSCVARPTSSTLAGNGNRNLVSHCQEAGGISVPSSLGNLCRFRAPFRVPNTTLLGCPAGFIGSPKASEGGCSVGPVGPEGSVLFPECPPPSVPDPTKGMGSVYCVTQGDPPPPPPPVTTPPPPLPPPPPPPVVEAPLCPVDPDWDATEAPPGDTPGAWDPEPGGYDAVTNRRLCKYNKTCPAGTLRMPLPVDQGGDGVNPGCISAPATSCPYPFFPISSLPLKCAASEGATVPTIAQCGAGFRALDANDPNAKEWNDPDHIVCY